MARPKKVIDTTEVDEIIQLILEKLEYKNNKLNYNNVWQFNQKLVEEGVLRKNNEPFNLYGYAFWASSYNGEPYYGKSKIDEIKTTSPIVIAGENMDITEADVHFLIKRYKHRPEELSRRFIKIFEKNNSTIQKLKNQNIELNKQIIKLRSEKESLENSLLMLFYNSQYTTNSMVNIMSSSKEGDSLLKKEFKNIYKITENPLFQQDTINSKGKGEKIIDISSLNKLL